MFGIIIINMRYLALIILCFNCFCGRCQAQSINEKDLIKQADSLYNNANYKRAASIYNMVFKANSRPVAFDLYKGASANAHINKNARAINYLELLVSQNHLKRYDSLLTDSNFLSLHKDKRWHNVSYLISTYKDDIEHRYGKTIKQELIEINSKRISQKRLLDSLVNSYGWRSVQAADERKLIATTDSANFLKVQTIINTYGYMGPQIIGTEANQVMFNIILNKDASIAKKYIPIVWQAYLKGNASANNYAALVDKVALRESNTQIYGTIMLRKDGRYYAPAVLDTVKVDSLRKQIGLPPFREYLKEFGN